MTDDNSPAPGGNMHRHGGTDTLTPNVTPHPLRRSVRDNAHSGLQSVLNNVFHQSSPRQALFVDAEAMKARMRANLGKAEYNVADLYHTTGIFQLIARSQYFESIALIVISVNAIWIAVDADHNNAAVLIEADPVFQVVENLFCVFFVSELSIRFAAFMVKRDAFKDAWFVFDSVLVATMVLETWVMMIVFSCISSSGSTGFMGNASILRIFRLLRLTRMARLARLLKNMPELLILIKGMVAALRSVLFTLLLLGIICYVFGILFKQLTEDSEIGNEFFGSVPAAMHTLLVHGTFLDDLADLIFPITEANLFWTLIFYVYVLFSALTVMNMLIGVLCEVVTAVAATEKEALNCAWVKDKMERIFDKNNLWGGSDDHTISKAEFHLLLEIPEATQALTAVGVDPVALVDLADFIFEDIGEVDLEADDSCSAPQHAHGKTMSFPEFLDLLLQLRGANTATVKDIVDLRKFVRKESQSTHHHLWRLEERFNRTFKESEVQRTESMASMASMQDPGGGPVNASGRLARASPGEGADFDRTPSKRGDNKMQDYEEFDRIIDEFDGDGAARGSASLELVDSSLSRYAGATSSTIPDSSLMDRSEWLEQILTTGQGELRKYLEWVARTGHQDANPEVVIPGSSDSPRFLEGQAGDIQPLEFASMKALDDALQVGLMAIQQVQQRCRRSGHPYGSMSKIQSIM